MCPCGMSCRISASIAEMSKGGFPLKLASKVRAKSVLSCFCVGFYGPRVQFLVKRKNTQILRGCGASTSSRLLAHKPTFNRARSGGHGMLSLYSYLPYHAPKFAK